jgi:membrane peptidoglycan carboxypeptidase
MASMLADVVNAGTAYRARQSGFTLPAAGKTGTTNDYVDAWFVGFTPKVVTGVWIGFDQPKTIIRNGYAGEIAVPLWAGFMKVATKGDKPEWLARPANVIGTNVCRISGKLPAGGCDHVEVVNRDGFVEKRSMIYTDYFVKGTQPTEECPLHPDRGFLDALAGVFGKDSGPPPTPVGATGLPSAPPPPRSAGTASAPAAPPAPAEAEPAPQKKRGFWSRIFGGGRDKQEDDKKDEDRKKEEQKKKSGG